MEQPIKAGMILKTKFTTAGNKKFMEYINYIDRDEAGAERQLPKV